MFTNNFDNLDITGESADHVEVELQHRNTGDVLYVHVNGRTVFRMCRINPANFKITKES